MKQFKIVILSILLAAVGFTSCEKMLYVESDRYLYAENNTLQSPNDSLYSLVGILTKFQLLGDQYVILGELRGDMMDVTHNATQDMIDLNNLDYGNPGNEFLTLTNHYAVINNCNYLIHHMNDSLLVGGEFRLKREIVAAKSIRAWTYLQLALNFNGAYYYDQPILTVAESQEIANNPEYFKNREEIFSLLAAELLPLVDEPLPDYAGISQTETQYLIPSVPYLLGEIYLWQNNYQGAASMYYKDILNNEKVVSDSYSSMLETLEEGAYFDENSYSNTYFNGYLAMDRWSNWFLGLSSATAAPEASAVVRFYASDKYGRFNASKLFRYTIGAYQICPSRYAMDWYQSQPYRHQGIYNEEHVNINTYGDLRGFPGSIYRLVQNIESMKLAGYSASEMESYEQMPLYKEPLGTPYIKLYDSNAAGDGQIVLQRSTMAYLRYAEAVNRMGKPTLALAVVNNGLKTTTMNDSTLIRVSEKDSTLVAEWSLEVFQLNNVGTRTRGQGPSMRVSFVFEKDSAELTLADSVLFVEQVLLDECGLESAFNGNRFHDLLRYTNHGAYNGMDAPNYIAKALGNKYPERATEFAGKNLEDWFIPYPHVYETVEE